MYLLHAKLKLFNNIFRALLHDRKDHALTIQSVAVSLFATLLTLVMTHLFC